MPLIPMLRSADLQRSIQFYTGILDFELLGAWQENGAPGFAILSREGAELHISEHRGDGVFGTVFCLLCENIDPLFERFRARGLDSSGQADSPVHQQPLWQSWGNREFYIRDPDGNTLRLIQRAG